MTEFGSTLLSCIKLAAYESQAVFADKAGVAESAVTRAIAGEPFRATTLVKLITPFSHAQQVELVRAYIKDRLIGEGVPESVVAAALDTREILLGEETSPNVRTLALQVARAAADDSQFATVLHDLLAMIREHESRAKLQLVAEPAAKFHISRPALPRGRSQEPTA